MLDVFQIFPILYNVVLDTIVYSLPLCFFTTSYCFLVLWYVISGILEKIVYIYTLLYTVFVFCFKSKTCCTLFIVFFETYFILNTQYYIFNISY